MKQKKSAYLFTRDFFIDYINKNMKRLYKKHHETYEGNFKKIADDIKSEAEESPMLLDWFITEIFIREKNKNKINPYYKWEQINRKDVLICVLKIKGELIYMSSEDPIAGYFTYRFGKEIIKTVKVLTYKPIKNK